MHEVQGFMEDSIFSGWHSLLMPGCQPTRTSFALQSIPLLEQSQSDHASIAKVPIDYFSKQPIVLIAILGFSLQQQNVCPVWLLFSVLFPSIRLTEQTQAHVGFEPGLADAAPAVHSPTRRGRVK